MKEPRLSINKRLATKANLPLNKYRKTLKPQKKKKIDTASEKVVLGPPPVLKKLEDPILDGIVQVAKAHWPPRCYPYLVGLDNAVQVADYYYREYLPGQSPVISPVAEQDRPRLIFLSESHARTNPSLVGKPILPQYQHLVPPKYQKGHLNLIHSLSYGEAWLAGIQNDKSAAAGTYKFWQVFNILAGIQQEITDENLEALMAPVMKGKNYDMETTLHQANETITDETMEALKAPVMNGGDKETTADENMEALKASVVKVKKQKKDKETRLQEKEARRQEKLNKEHQVNAERLQAKIDILERMEQRGIKLVDLTPVHIYLSSKTITKTNQEKGTTYTTRKAVIKGGPERAIIRHSWEKYIKPYLATYRPHQIVVLGKSLRDLVQEKHIQQFTQSIGVEYLGTRNHPSHHFTREERIEEFNWIRRTANNSQGGGK
ncbi:expressed unknown protein [Seminavis robusta]|uniref:Uncharacterized protein n=1 Tax=Seminavis robusta TaxID=568900 RepID=A0A9N8H711_9STRA|nr:expressed unknown protein [Seminavis robusta]|eukprot:Sro57_g033420.1 n/a (434) ;mRNA; r:91733-93034